MKKGRPIFIEGRLRLDSWEDKNTGQKRSKLGVVMESFQFMGQGGGDTAGGGGSSRSNTTPSATADSPPPEDDDVPF
jgi:single-strand DNA-binding protein